MPFSIRPHRRFPVHCAVTYHADPFQGHGTEECKSVIPFRSVDLRENFTPDVVDPRHNASLLLFKQVQLD